MALAESSYEVRVLPEEPNKVIGPKAFSARPDSRLRPALYELLSELSPIPPVDTENPSGLKMDGVPGELIF